MRMEIIPFGEHAILLNWSRKIDDFILFEVLNVKKALVELYAKQKVQINSTYNSILVNYDLTIKNIYSEIPLILDHIKDLKPPVSTSYEIIQIPVCYDLRFGMDLKRMANLKNMTSDELISLHCSTDYRVFFVGFLPGFLYLGGLDKRLSCPRLETPRQQIPKGSVAIGGDQTGIYPRSSPGGWNIIGRTPLNLFNPDNDPPVIANPGDKVRFVPVDYDEYLDIKDELKKGHYKLVKDFCDD